MKVFVNDLDSDRIDVIDYNGQMTTYSVSQELAVNEQNYQQEFIRQPAKYAFWSAVLQQAKYVLAAQESRLEKVHAQVYNKVNTALLKEGMRPTKDLIEAQIVLDDEYQKAKSQVETCEYSVSQVQYLVKAFEQRKDMLVQFGADMRKDNNYGN